MRSGTHHTIHAEHAIIGFVAKVATIRPIASAVGSVVIHGLVYPVPDSTAHDEVIALNDVPIVHQVADCVTHGVGILRKCGTDI